MRSSILVVGLAGLLLSVVSTAAPKPETVIRYRQSVYTVIGWNFVPLVKMVKGETPWDGPAFALHAERIAELAPQLMEGFAEGSDKGAKTDAKPEIWQSMDDFKTKMDDLVTQSKALADVAKSGDEAKTREQFKKTAGACKACHDKYRADD